MLFKNMEEFIIQYASFFVGVNLNHFFYVFKSSSFLLPSIGRKTAFGSIESLTKSKIVHGPLETHISSSE